MNKQEWVDKAIQFATHCYTITKKGNIFTGITNKKLESELIDNLKNVGKKLTIGELSLLTYTLKLERDLAKRIKDKSALNGYILEHHLKNMDGIKNVK